MYSNIILRPFIVAIAFLLIPLAGQLFIDGWNWGIEDFVFAFVAIFVTGLLYEVLSRQIQNRGGRIVLALVLLALLAAVWAQAAVGIMPSADTPTEQAVVDEGPDSDSDPDSSGSLVGTWVWEETNMNDGASVIPADADAFAITFKADGTVSGTTDCNGFFGTYTETGGSLAFGPLASTKMFCEGSQEMRFTADLSNVSGYLQTEDLLILTIKFDSGIIRFVRQ